VSHITTALTKNIALPSVASAGRVGGSVFPSTSIPIQHQQIRTVTKKRVHRQEKRKRKEILAAQGIFPPKPHNYIPKDTSVLNAVSKEERLADSRRQDERAAQELQKRMQDQNDTKPEVFRFGLTDSTDLVMSDRVKKLLNLHNGNQKEVVKAQKQQAMEIFQLREGDTGSSAVQVIALTTRIQQIQTHYSKHKKDKHSKRGLDALYVRRRKLLDYMERKDFESYRKVVKTLGLNH
jgi:small subunit ribosomal protein S15